MKKQSPGTKNIPYIILTAFILIILVPMQVTDTDIFFHLKYGEHFLHNATWNIDHSMFSWAHTDNTWRYVTWLGDIIFYIVYMSSGLWGILFIQWAVYFIIVFLFYRFYSLFTGQFNIEFLVLLILVYACIIPHGILPTNELFSLLFFSLTVYLVFYSQKRQTRVLYVLPAIFLIWVNMHGGFIIGLVFINIIISTNIVKTYILLKNKISKSTIFYQITVLLLTNLSVFINPYKWDYLLEIVSSFFTSSQGQQFATITAYLPTTRFLISSSILYDNKYLAAWGLVLLGLLFLYTVWLMIKHNKLLKSIDILWVNLIFLLFSALFIRNVFYFPILFMYSLLFINFKIKKITPEIHHFPTKTIMVTCCLLLIIRFVFVQPFHQIIPEDISQSLTVKETEFLLDNALPAPIFNDYKSGNYLLWKAYPQYKVFVDARYGPYEKQVYPLYYKILYNNPDKLLPFLEMNQIKTVFIRLSHIASINHLINSPHWEITFVGPNAALFVDTREFNLKKYEFKPSDFTTIKNPITIHNLFKFFLLYDIKNSEFFLDLYEKNVSGLYLFKSSFIENMKEGYNAVKLYYQNREHANENK